MLYWSPLQLQLVTKAISKITVRPSNPQYWSDGRQGSICWSPIFISAPIQDPQAMAPACHHQGRLLFASSLVFTSVRCVVFAKCAECIHFLCHQICRICKVLQPRSCLICISIFADCCPFLVFFTPYPYHIRSWWSTSLNCFCWLASNTLPAIHTYIYIIYLTVVTKHAVRNLNVRPDSSLWHNRDNSVLLGSSESKQGQGGN